MSAVKPVLRTLGLLGAGAWICGTTLFFFVRFSFVFYEANRSSLDQFAQRIHHWLNL